jgi:hypothetical protein
VLSCVVRKVTTPTNKGLCYIDFGLAIDIKKHLKAKEELGKLKYFTMQKYNLPPPKK